MLDGIGLWSGAMAAAVTLLVLVLLRPVAFRLNLVDHPKGRKDHVHPTPVVGGIAMLAGLLATGALVLTEVGPSLVAFLLGSVVLVAAGLLDDIHDLRWYMRIGVQVAVALLMVHVGGVRVDQLGDAFGVTSLPLGWLAVPFTVVATVGLINAINLIDGADGLAGTLVLVALVTLTAAAVYSGNLLIAERGLVLAGVVAAFLWFNLRFPWRPHARVFMGNAGSAFLGFAIAWMSFRLTQSPSHPVSPVLALWCVAIPVMDCLVLMFRRLRNGRSPFHGDHNHIHHLMMDAGFGPTQAALVLGGFTVVCALLVGQAMRMDVPNPLLLAAYLLMCLGWFWLTRRRARAVAFFEALRPAWLFGEPAARPRAAVRPASHGHGEDGAPAGAMQHHRHAVTPPPPSRRSMRDE